MKTKIVFISGGENHDPAAIKAELDKIRGELSLDDDVVLFGIPAERDEGRETRDEPKIIQFPIRKKPILNIIARAEEPAPVKIEIERTEKLVVDFDDDDDDESESITDILGKLPSINEDAPPAAESRTLTDEFAEYLDREEPGPAPKKIKALPFKRKKSAFTNVLGDLFTFAGGAANDDSRDYVLPDFIKRP